MRKIISFISLTPDDLLLAIFFTITGIAATALFTVWSLKKSSKATDNRLNSLESLELTNARIMRDANPNAGRAVQREDGNYSAHFDRKVDETISISEKINAIKNAGTDREERIE